MKEHASKVSLQVRKAVKFSQLAAKLSILSLKMQILSRNSSGFHFVLSEF